jgi:hypothetical protein
MGSVAVPQLSKGQMHAAVEFYERTGAATAKSDVGAMLLACTYEHEVDAVGFTVLLDDNRRLRHGKYSIRYRGSGPGYCTLRLIALIHGRSRRVVSEMANPE